MAGLHAWPYAGPWPPEMPPEPETPLTPEKALDTVSRQKMLIDVLWQVHVARELNDSGERKGGFTEFEHPAPDPGSAPRHGDPEHPSELAPERARAALRYGWTPPRGPFQ